LSTPETAADDKPGHIYF